MYSDFCRTLDMNRGRPSDGDVLEGFESEWKKGHRDKKRKHVTLTQDEPADKK